MKERIKRCSWCICNGSSSDSIFIIRWRQSLWVVVFSCKLCFFFWFTEAGPTQSQASSPPNISTTGEPLDLNKTACEFTIMSDESMCLCLRFKCKYFSPKAAVKQNKGILCGFCRLLFVNASFQIVPSRLAQQSRRRETVRAAEVTH